MRRKTTAVTMPIIAAGDQPSVELERDVDPAGGACGIDEIIAMGVDDAIAVVNAVDADLILVVEVMKVECTMVEDMVMELECEERCEWKIDEDMTL